MSIHRLLGDKAVQQVHLPSHQQLKSGDVVQGKVIKLFPDHKAKINLAGKQMIAQLETPLIIGERYHFQVKHTQDQILHLQVLANNFKNNTEQSAIQLIQQLGLKPTKISVAFMQSLIKQQMPFNQNSFIQSVHLLQSREAKEIPIKQQFGVLHNLMEKKLPISHAIFQSTMKLSTGGISNSIEALLKESRNQNIRFNPLLYQLEQVNSGFKTENMSIIKYMASDLNNTQTNGNLYHIFKNLGMISPSITKNQWNQAWMSMVENTPKSLVEGRTLPFSMDHSALMKGIDQLTANQSKIIELTRSMLQVNDGSVTHSKNLINFQKIADLLPESISLRFSEALMKGQPRSFLETLNNPNTYHELDNMLKTLQNPVLNHSPQLGKIQQLFLQQVQWMNQRAGLNYEHQLAHQQIDINNVKAQLIQLVQSSSGSLAEKAQQLLNHIQGIQINSITESNGFLQAFLQIPAQKLGLAKDIDLQFESKKTKDGKIDPEYCRVLFYLSLNNIKDTVIDMHVQKRNVTVTIYNDFTDLENFVGAMKENLNQGLKQNDYRLSSVHIKAMDSLNEGDKEHREKRYYPSSYQGVDFRV
ncbi:hypothetical protein [Oceanobacillus kimchii]|uniref:hypothetical protein n=1 Tax=Oceanobacillus kimchii TaxID=746691 RepID=UPI00232E685A|nr:hypothetical protein [Oceanobacillus kimchii]